jgi:hypothetical protein
MKVLNLDMLDTGIEKRNLRLNGNDYAVEEMTVANFIETTRVAEKIADEPSLVLQIEATVEMILRSVPTLTKEALIGLSLVQLQTIVAFIRGDEDVDGVEKTEGEAGK